jgi:hypothetical protein
MFILASPDPVATPIKKIFLFGIKGIKISRELETP